MKERPILFSAEMVRAILENRKSVTRRVIKTDHTLLDDPNILPATIEAYKTAWVKTCPYGQPGDRLWVRETWADSFASDDDSHNGYVYAATNHGPEPRRWRPSILMPRLASRITLEITGVRVERVQDITEEDAMVEGFKALHVVFSHGPSYRDTFIEYWNLLNAKRGYGWDANPFVWVIEFKRSEGARP